jgi:phage baseplate assembly protein W
MRKVLKVSDIDYSFRAHPVSGNLILKKNEDAIKQSVKTLVMLNLLEKPFSTIGGNVRNKLFEDFNFILEDKIKTEITSLLKTYETRIILDEIYINHTDNTISITLEYTIIGEELGIQTVSMILTKDR